jgi:hypothetical protein
MLLRLLSRAAGSRYHNRARLEKGHEGRNITADHRNVKVPRELIGDTLVEARGSKTAATSFAITDMCGDAKYIQQARSWP